MHTSWRLAAWYFAYFAVIGAFMPYFGLYLQALGLEPWRIAVLMSVGQVVRLLAPAAWGWLADRHGRRVRVVAGTGAGALASFLLFFLARDFVGLLACMLLLHLFWSAALPLMEALTLDHLAAAPERYGRIRLWGSLGFIVAVLAVGAALDHFPIAGLLWMLAGLLLVSLLVSLRVPEVPDRPLAAALPLRRALFRREVLVLFAAGFFMTAAHSILYVFYSIHLVAHGYGKAAAGVLWSLGVVAEIGVFLVMPRLVRRFALRPILLVCLALAALRFGVIGWAVALVPLAVLAQVLHGVTFGAHHAASVAALGAWFPSGQQARAQALFGSATHGAGGILGALIAGQTWQLQGGEMTFTAAAGLALLGLALVWRGIPANPPRPAVQ